MLRGFEVEKVSGDAIVVMWLGKSYYSWMKFFGVDELLYGYVWGRYNDMMEFLGLWKIFEE